VQVVVPLVLAQRVPEVMPIGGCDVECAMQLSDARGVVAPWATFAHEAPALAAVVRERLLDLRVAYLATTARNGAPRVHPVSPIITEQGLYVFMEPTSPKGHDLRRFFTAA
jgi:hypothetical protein